MKTIKTNNAELLLVKVPKDCIEFSIVSNMLYTSLGFPFKDKIIHLPSIGYQIVNTLSNLTEEQAKELVEWYITRCYDSLRVSGYVDIIVYLNYKNRVNFNPSEAFTQTAIESFHSLMAVNEVYLSNPFDVKNMPDPYKYMDHPDEYDRLWQQSENNTSEYLILIKK